MTQRHTHPRFLAAFAAFAAPLLLVSCGGLGKLHTDVVGLYDDAMPGGTMEFEYDRNGCLREAEADIEPSKLPEAVRAAALDAAKAQASDIFGAEIELQGGRSVYEVKLRKDGRDWEFILDATGKIWETEQSLRRSEAPIGVVEAALGRIQGGTFQTVEVIKHLNANGQVEHEEYHVKISRDGASYKIVLDGSAKILRAVREHKAEIEIPLKG
jgi:hypothetical protein